MKTKHLIWLGVALAAIGIVLQLQDNTYLLTVGVIIGINSIAAIGVSLVMGYAGQIPLGQGGFVGLGAYISALLSVHFGISPWITTVIAAFVTGYLAYAIGKPMLKLHGHALALITCCVGLILFYAFTLLIPITGGYSGFGEIPRFSIAGFVLKRDIHFYSLVWAMVLVLLTLSSNIVNSRIGRAMRAMNLFAGGSEVATQALGIDVAEKKVHIFVLSAVFASLSGSMYAHYVTHINPMPFSIWLSMLLVMICVIGGMGSLFGAIVGTVFLVLLKEFLPNIVTLVVPGSTGEYEVIVYGIIFVLTVMFLPAGLAEVPDILRKAWRQKSGVRSPGMEVEP